MRIKGFLTPTTLAILMTGLGALGAVAQPDAMREQHAATGQVLQEIQYMNPGEQYQSGQNQTSEIRAEALNELHRSEREGLNVSAARDYMMRGDQAMQAGNYGTAQRYFAYAREAMNERMKRHLYWGPLSSWSGTNP